MIVQKYTPEIQRQYTTSVANSFTLRQLLAAMVPQLAVFNEPVRQVCDVSNILQHNDENISVVFIEAKRLKMTIREYVDEI